MRKEKGRESKNERSGESYKARHGNSRIGSSGQRVREAKTHSEETDEGRGRPREVLRRKHAGREGDTWGWRALAAGA